MMATSIMTCRAVHVEEIEQGLNAANSFWGIDQHASECMEVQQSREGDPHAQPASQP